ncbi:hypothetical protein [Varunaivibrio sulfuroxidans]|uniref:Uncharacterized protein n=1 Tax=Varunaivibrio sulfuroxidans TaxID=1773489 RepID=A0A4R3J8I8_9PROT|nr:hypothetical protein [Varunaivibrio sulfuroxidans]TCS61233.1 hypothetical protein EDD55_10831 [Varunaivibrio sulfuroxidans]WES31146.1 hypothetical protein P3M64_01860 [Varunaivibrio sulfuroxidans]
MRNPRAQKCRKPIIFRHLEEEEKELLRKEPGALSVAAFRHKKWREIHKYLHNHPFHVNSALERSQQWRRVFDFMRTIVEEDEITDWLLVQIDVANNLERGIRDLRPRKNGPCYDVFMEFIRDRKRKAKVVHRWLQDAQTQGSALTWSVPDQMGLKNT